jgi:hypothetical protein
MTVQRDGWFVSRGVPSAEAGGPRQRDDPRGWGNLLHNIKKSIP